MKQTISMYQFERGFVDHNRSDNFSYEGKKLLFDYFEQLEEDLREDLEFDVISICCEYSEEDVDDIIANYSIEIDGDSDKMDQVTDYLSDETSIVGIVDDSIIYQQF